MTRRSPLRFFLLVFALSIPFWLLDPLAERFAGALPVNLPVSSLMAVVPFIAAAILVGRGGARQLLQPALHHAGGSVLAAVLFHALDNTSVFLFPDYGSHYDPAVTGTIIAIAAAIVTFVWGPETLARYRRGEAGGLE